MAPDVLHRHEFSAELEEGKGWKAGAGDHTQGFGPPTEDCGG